MTEDDALRSSALANAYRVLSKHGLWRQIPLILGILLNGLLDGLGIATFLPILVIASGGASKTPTKLEQIIYGILEHLHLPASLGVLILIAGGCMVLKAIVSLVVARAIGFAVAEIATDLRRDVVDRLLRARWSYFTVNPVGRFAAAVSTEANWASFAYKTSLNVFASGIKALVYCIIVLLIDWRVAIGAMILGVGLGLTMRFLTQMSRRAGRQQRVSLRTLISDLTDVVTGFKPLKAMYRHETLIAGLKAEADRLRQAMYELAMAEQLANALPDLLIVALLVASTLVAVSLFGIEFSALLISLYLTNRLIDTFATVQRAIQETAQSESNYWSLQATINEANEAAETFAGTAQPSLKKACRLDGITFSYGLKPVLTDVSLEIPAGQITTLIGKSGSGKTTIADLILGLFVPDRGTVTLDGVALREIDIAKWRDMIGYVPQEVLLFNDTVFANVALGDPRVTEEQVVEALRAAGAAEFILSQPRGIQADVGEYGAKLSGGQRQRIALARALVHRPTLLILDEATSALDPDTEADICATVRRQAGAMTVLAITHQPAWVEAADRVYRVVDGRVERAEMPEINVPATA